jgi:transporter family protein
MAANAQWVWFALGSAFFAALTSLLGKLGVTELNSNMATFVRSIVIVGVTACVISLRNEWPVAGSLVIVKYG